MVNLFSYVDNYGDITFSEKCFNDIDNLVFSSLAYLDFSNTSVNNGKHTLEEIGIEYLNKCDYKRLRLRFAQKEAYILLKKIINKKRYKDIILYNYIYTTNKDTQFSAVTFKISNRLKYICFEGTDELISGWKEDGKLACIFPVPSHVSAIKYVNDNISFFDKDVIIGGHSKGGNLALVAAMYIKKHKKHKLKKVYSNDGPGLRKNEFESKEYKSIKKKYVHIVPDCSIVGVLLRNDSYVVVKSSKKNILGHMLSSWIVDDDELFLSELSTTSKKLEKSIISWLEKHDDEERTMIVNKIFSVLEDAEVDAFNNVRDIKKIIKIIHNVRNIDKQTKDLIIDFITYTFNNIIN